MLNQIIATDQMSRGRQALGAIVALLIITIAGSLLTRLALPQHIADLFQQHL
jgi:hypothetical protein